MFVDVCKTKSFDCKDVCVFFYSCVGTQTLYVSIIEMTIKKIGFHLKPSNSFFHSQETGQGYKPHLPLNECQVTF